MKSLKITKKEREERKKKYSEPCSIDGGDAYPYGARISLNEEMLDKLDIDKLPRVGVTMTLTAKVKVIAVSENQREGGEKSRHIELQITDMDLESGSSAEDAVRAAVGKA